MYLHLQIVKILKKTPQNKNLKLLQIIIIIEIMNIILFFHKNHFHIN